MRFSYSSYHIAQYRGRGTDHGTLHPLCGARAKIFSGLLKPIKSFLPKSNLLTVANTSTNRVNPSKGYLMPSKGKRVIGAKLNEYECQMIETYANTHNLSVSALIGILVKGVLGGDIEIEKGELKIGVNPISYAENDDFAQRVEDNLNELRDREYPERFIESMKEQIISGLTAQISMLPKKYDSRRIKNDDCGA